MGKKGGWWALSHEYKVCKCPHIHKKLQPKKISIPIALFTARQNVKKKTGMSFPGFKEWSSINDLTVAYECFIPLTK